MTNTTQLVLFLAALGSQVYESSTDGDGLNFEDAPEFIDEMISAPEAFTGIGEIPSEIRNSTQGDRDKLFEAVAGKVKGITSDEVDILIDEAVVFASSGGRVFAAVQTVLARRDV